MVLVHERIGPVPAFDLIRDVVMRFPAIGVVFITADTSTGVLTAAMDSGARGIIGLPLGYDALAERVQAAGRGRSSACAATSAAAPPSCTRAPAAPSSPSPGRRAASERRSPPSNSPSPPRRRGAA